MEKNLIAIILFLAAFLPLEAQSHHHSTPDDEHTHPPFRIALLIGHTFVPAEHSAERLAIPSWGLDLEYWFHEKWGVGLHNDLELETFIIEEGQDEFLERRYPLVMTLDALYNPWKGLVFVTGPGIELEANENLFLLRFGLEYEFELQNHWDISPSFFYDTRQGTFDTWSFAFGVARRF